MTSSRSTASATSTCARCARPTPWRGAWARSWAPPPAAPRPGAGGMAEIVDAAAGAPAPSVICGAGLENRPDLVARLAEGRELLGCPPSVLGRVRDPAALAASLRAAGFHYPRTFAPAAPAPPAPCGPGPAGRWLRKPVRGGGGRGVREWRGEALPDGVLVQERIDGVPCSVAAVGAGRSAVVLGVTEQLIGRAQLGASGFAWCGNVTPPRVPTRPALEDLCDHLAADFGLVGLFGVDFVWDGKHAWVVEVNPRPTGSLEILGGDPFGAHLAACAGRLAGRPAPAHGASGKVILYAARDTDVGDTADWPARGIRDVPHPGERIGAGHPICTLSATGPTPEAVVAELDDRAAALRAELRVHAVA